MAQASLAQASRFRASASSFLEGLAMAKVAINGKQFTADDITSGKVEIEEGTFILGYDDLANKDAILNKLKEDSWEPTNVMGAMPMIVGKMNGEKLATALAIDGVKYIEADGVVTIDEK